VFAPGVTTAAYLQVSQNRAETAKNRAMLVEGCNASEMRTKEFFISVDRNGHWDRSPSRVIWSNNAEDLYLTPRVQRVI
jgi:hypothetical protein